MKEITMQIVIFEKELTKNLIEAVESGDTKKIVAAINRHVDFE